MLVHVLVTVASEQVSQLTLDFDGDEDAGTDGNELVGVVVTVVVLLEYFDVAKLTVLVLAVVLLVPVLDERIALSMEESEASGRGELSHGKTRLEPGVEPSPG